MSIFFCSGSMKIAIIGAGISGLTLAYFIEKVSPHGKHEITIIESKDMEKNRETENYEGCMLEFEMDDIYLDSPVFQPMFEEIGCSLTPISKDFKKKFISKESQLMKAPLSFEKLYKTPLLFFTEKIKMSKALKKKYLFWPSISIYEAFKNVFGQNAAEYLSSPLVRYLFRSEAEDIELASAFPDLYSHLEGGNTIKDSYQNMKNEKKELLKSMFHISDSKLKEFQIGLFSPSKGISEFSKRLRIYLKSKNIKFQSCKVQNLYFKNQKYFVQDKNKKFGDYDSIVLATPALDTAKFLKNFDKDISLLLLKMKQTCTSTIYQAWSRNIFSMSGCGIFFPRIAKAPFLFILFLSNLYPEKSPSDIFLTRTCLSGDHTAFDDSDLVKVSLDTIKRNFKIKGDPLWSKVSRSSGLPKFFPGHSELKNNILIASHKYPKLYFHSKAFHGLQVYQQIEASSQMVRTNFM